MARFIEMNQKSKIKHEKSLIELKNKALNEKDKEMIGKTEKLAQEVTRLLNKYDFNHASQNLYDFMWHEFADIYIEDVKERIDENSYIVLFSLFIVLLKLLHPFMPFVTEEIYKRLQEGEDQLIVSEWPSFTTVSEG